MKKTIRKIEILFMALICIFAMSGMPMQVYAGPADNSLETLTVAEGSLSPAFEGSRMYYTVQVGQDVSSVTVAQSQVISIRNILYRTLFGTSAASGTFIFINTNNFSNHIFCSF